MTVSQDTTTWRKSTRSEQQGACIELSNTGTVRDSKNPGGPHLDLPWQSLIAAVRDDRLSR
ncbi:MAG: DUF397 domain-containing protein [Actinophytocola sp.]|uniref:DUF397 domain-containing protein n=1 Tax=Actinophytocola sp. TaxID=1872138 RepID=UPI003C70DE06